MNGSPIDQDWLATAVFAGFVVVVVLVWELFVARRFERFAGYRRLLYALGAALGSAQFAVIALFGPDQLIASKFGETAVLIMRLVSAAGSVWAAYLAVDQVRTWLRVGDKAEE